MKNLNEKVIQMKKNIKISSIVILLIFVALFVYSIINEDARFGMIPVGLVICCLIELEFSGDPGER